MVQHMLLSLQILLKRRPMEPSGRYWLRRDRPGQLGRQAAPAQWDQPVLKAPKVFLERQGRLGRRVRKVLWVRRDHRVYKVHRVLPVVRAYKVRPDQQVRRAMARP